MKVICTVADGLTLASPSMACDWQDGRPGARLPSVRSEASQAGLGSLEQASQCGGLVMAGVCASGWAE